MSSSSAGNGRQCNKLEALGCTFLCVLKCSFPLLFLSERSSKHVDELLSAASNVKFPVDNRPGDNALLKVIESYCAGGRRIATCKLKRVLCVCEGERECVCVVYKK